MPNEKPTTAARAKLLQKLAKDAKVWFDISKGSMAGLGELKGIYEDIDGIDGKSISKAWQGAGADALKAKTKVKEEKADKKAKQYKHVNKEPEKEITELIY